MKLILAGALLLAPVLAWSQTVSSQEISGVVEDATGSVVPNATVSVKNAETALAQQNLPLLAMLGHCNKSSARTVGAAGFACLWQSLEQLKENPDGDHAGQIVCRLRPLLARIEERVAALFPN